MTARIICKTQKFEKGCKLAKYIGIYMFVRKICMTYQNVQQNEIYLLMLSSCMLTTIEMMPLVKNK
jgi:hypothetical protein